MVRFHWHVEEGAGASILPGSMTYAAPADSGVQHVAVDIEIPGEAAAQACITVPAGYLRQAGQVGELGVLLGHADAAEWRGPLLDALAVMLAEAGERGGRGEEQRDATCAHSATCILHACC